MNLIPRKRIDADDNIGKGMDLALSMLLFLGLGYLVDRWLDTRPVFMIAFVVIALVGQFLRLWFAYEAKMKVLESERAAAARRRPV